MSRMTKRVIMPGIVLSFLFLFLSFFDEEFAIRRAIFFMGHPIDCITVKIERDRLNDPSKGQLFLTDGIRDRITGNDTFIFYVKKNRLGMYYVTGSGSGP
ncbi:hypothetical protein [Brevibacillus migulae]|uniref:hypothetical protein n=1 Tax=Brevibacillus migulae TaxID=1644114 RepID=UPI00106E71A0|nr:hypothetical protein [Brevibacillus migulae]